MCIYIYIVCITNYLFNLLYQSIHPIYQSIFVRYHLINTCINITFNDVFLNHRSVQRCPFKKKHVERPLNYVVFFCFSGVHQANSSPMVQQLAPAHGIASSNLCINCVPQLRRSRGEATDSVLQLFKSVGCSGFSP